MRDEARPRRLPHIVELSGIEGKKALDQSPRTGAGIGFDQPTAGGRDLAPDIDLVADQNGLAARHRFSHGDAEIFLMGRQDECVGAMERAPFDGA